MHLRNYRLQKLDPSNTHIIREIHRSDASSIFELEHDGKTYAMKLVSVGCLLSFFYSLLSIMTMVILGIPREVETSIGSVVS